MPNKISSFLIFLVTVFLILAFGTLGSLTYFSFLEKEESRMTSEMNLLASVAEKAFIQPLWTLDASLAKSMLDAFIDNNSIVKKVRLSHPDGSILAEASQVNFDKLLDLYERKVPIFFDGVQIGDATLYFSKEKLQSSLQGIKNSIILMFTLVTLNLIIIVTFALNYILGRPMEGLSKIAQSFHKGNYDFEKPDWLFEFKEIGASFWQANQDLQERDRRLTEYSQNLEETIQKRTKELDSQRLQIVNQSRLASLGEFSAGVAHEINNPLAVISGKGMLIKRKISNYPELASVNDDLDKIHNMVNRISRIIVGLRSFARDSSSEEKTTFLVAKFLDDIKDLCQGRMNNRGITLKIKVVPEDLKIYAREVQISQVLINLINNSTDAVEELAEKWIEINAWEDSTHVYLQVRDSGNGIPLETREKIFQPFFTTKETGRGTGIGLSISMGIVKEHNGELRYDDSSNRTAFVMKLPKT